MKPFTQVAGASHRVGCRTVYSEQAVWRDALGNTEPLLVFATYGCLDATSHIPTGGHSKQGATGYRPGNYA